ncbi:MAG: tRNA (guanosine(37)-N1)-methyltransferase TrmD [Patescibacteria group bacterium]|nr:tRNA (guanosine(37)-N1)-methyltransferase TrmD [Patescibacteria group bacterium]
MRFDIITIFPTLFDSFLNESLIKKSVDKKINRFLIHDLRKWAKGKHHQVDDRPFGGGAGMVLMAEPIIKALKHISIKALKHKNKITNNKQQITNNKTLTILLSPAGKQFNQKMAEKFSKYDQIIFICGRYEGIDARVEKFVDEKISIGPYVLNGGEVAAMVMIEAVARLQPGFVGNCESLKEESFNNDKKEYPQYTRPEVLAVNNKKMKVPPVLMSGDHKKIKEWREKNSKK